MKIGLRKITWADNSIGRYMIVNNDAGAGRIKITVKQWKVLEKMGFHCDEMKAEMTEKGFVNILS